MLRPLSRPLARAPFGSRMRVETSEEETTASPQGRGDHMVSNRLARFAGSYPRPARPPRLAGPPPADGIRHAWSGTLRRCVPPVRRGFWIFGRGGRRTASDVASKPRFPRNSPPSRPTEHVCGQYAMLPGVQPLGAAGERSGVQGPVRSSRPSPWDRVRTSNV
jgi:hypothetical protein